MKSFSKSTAIGGGIGFVVVVGGALCVSEFGAMSAKQAAVGKLKSQVAQMKNVRSQLAQTQGNLNDGLQQMQHLEASVSQAEYVPTLLSELEKFGNANGMLVIGVRPIENKVTKKDGDPEAKKPYVELNIEVKGRGKYADVQRFVGAIKSFPKIVAVRTIDIQPKSGTANDQGALNVTVTLRAYVFAPPATDGKPKDAQSDGKTAMLGLGVNRSEG